MKSALRLLVLTGVTLVPVTWALVTAFEGTLRVQRETALSALQETARTLAAAVEHAARDAVNDNAGEPVVLLSPACASFDQFQNFEKRGDAFRQAVMSLPGVRRMGEA